MITNRLYQRLSPIYFQIILLLLSFLTASLEPHSLRAAEPVQEIFGFSLPTPGFVLEQFFGQETEENQKALDNVEVSLQVESQLGSEAAQNCLRSLRRQGIRIITHGHEVGYLKCLANEMRRYMKNAERYPSIQVYLVDSPLNNAYCFPGGTIVLYRGMLANATSEATLAGIIGHELSHLDHGHQLRQYRRSKLAQQAFDTSDSAISPERLFRGSCMMIRIWTRPFNPEDEAIADQDGATWAYRAGYDPREMAKFFLKAHRYRKRNQEKSGAFVRSHPFHLERYKAVQALYRRLQKADPQNKLYIGRSNLRYRIPRSEKDFKEFANR